MPSDQRVGSHDRQDRPPFDQSRQHDEHHPRRIIRTPRLYLPLDVHGQLLSKEQILGNESGTRSSRRREQPQDVSGEVREGSDRAAGTGLGHGRGIVRDAPAERLP